MPPKEATIVQDIETTRRTSRFASFRAFLTEQAPGSVLASEQFYEQIDGPYSTKFSDLLSECRTRAWFIRNDETGHVRIATKQCRLRWCFFCAEARQQFITNQIYPWYSRAKEPKLFTITIRHTENTLPEQIDFLYKSFQKLRNRKFLKDNIRGGVWFFQVTFNQKTQQWHPHIHALLDSKFMMHAKLITLWDQITNGSTIVHIRTVNDPEKTLAHNARYAARPTDLLKIPKSKWSEIFEAFNGRRIVGTWGTARKISLTPKKPEDAERWHDIGGFRTVHSLIAEDDNACCIWTAWRLGTPLDENIDMKHIETKTEDSSAIERAPPHWETDPYLEFV